MSARSTRSAAETRIRAATEADCADLAALHAAMLPHGFFVDLGPRFLRAYHRTFVESPHAVGYVATTQGRRVGGLVGALDNRAHWAWIVRRRGLRLAVTGAADLARQPRLTVRFVRTRARRYVGALGRLLGWRRRGTGGAAPEPPRRTAVLSHVCVHPSAQGCGVGGALVETFVEDARAAGAAEAALVTLADARGAGDFYARRGWVHEGDRRDQDGNLISVYTRTLL